MKVSLGEIRSDYEGFAKLARLHKEILLHEGEHHEILEVDMAATRWMDANMCAPFGAILHAARMLKYRILRMPSRVGKILQKNGFLPNFGFDREKLPDSYGTTIEYKRFERTDAQAFKRYVEMHFVGKSKGLPAMTPGLLGKFRQSISEMFENAVDHSNTQMGIFACGQHFPGGRGYGHARLDFSIADLGDGMKNVIRQKLGLDLPPEAAIEWAMAGNNTTRTPEGGKPGGLGLKLIREFIGLNHGKFQVVSDAGYWSFKDGKAETKPLPDVFPGTIVNVEINAADKASYRLASEVDPSTIF
jgi:hypothetical protein